MSFPRSILLGICSLAGAVCCYAQEQTDLSHFMTFSSQEQALPLEKALQEAAMALEQSRETNDAAAVANALRDLGLIYLNRVPDHEKALDLFIRCLAIEDSLELEEHKVLTYVAIANVFERVGDYHKSAHYLEQALLIYPERKEINTVAMILNALGNVNARRGLTDVAFANYQQVLRYRQDIGKAFEAEALLNLGRLYTQEGEFTSALANHKEALAVARTLEDRHAEAISLTEIGVLYHLMKNVVKSFANHKVALELRQALGDKRGMAESHNNIGWLHLEQGDAPLAITYGLLALEHGREAQAQEQIFRSYDLLSKAYKNTGDFKNALTNSELGLAMFELIQGEKQERHLLETQSRYVIGKKESQIEELEALRIEREYEIAAQKKFRNILYLVVVLIFSIAGLLFILYLVKRRSNHILRAAKKEVQDQNQKLLALNQTKDKFFSIISHDLKGPLNSLTSFSRLLIDHTDSLSKDEIRFLAKDLDKSVKNLLTLLENLLEWARAQTGNIDFTPEEFDLAELLTANRTLLESQAKSKEITIIFDHPGNLKVSLHKQSINTVVRNLVSNAIKFTPAGGTIRMGVNLDRAGVSVFVTDSGVGMPADVLQKLFKLGNKHSTSGTSNEKGTGLGLILCREFVEKNGGRILAESEPGKGSTFKFSFPMSVVKNPAGNKMETVPF